MELHYLLVVICCLLPFVVGSICFVRHDNEPVQQVKTDTKFHQTFQTAENFMLIEYDSSKFSSSNRFNVLLQKLEEVNLCDPLDRVTNEKDEWFKKATSQLMHDGSCLAYINHYEQLEASFWRNMVNLGLKPEQDEKFQQLLISVHKTYLNDWAKNFNNLLFNFGLHYQLLPQVEYILQTDSRFVASKQAYKFARECAKKRKT